MASIEKWLVVLTFCLFTYISSIYGQSSGDLRLVDVDGESAARDAVSQGRVEIFLSANWGSICDNWIDANTTGQVICFQLGYSTVRDIKTDCNPFEDCYNPFGIGSGQIWLGNIVCDGSELRLLDCSHGGWGQHDCLHSEDVWIVCEDPITLAPTSSPTRSPLDFGETHPPTPSPTQSPTSSPSNAPTSPTSAPTATPTQSPTTSPSQSPTSTTSLPTVSPTHIPTFEPTQNPITTSSAPTQSPVVTLGYSISIESDELSVVQLRDAVLTALSISGDSVSYTNVGDEDASFLFMIVELNEDWIANEVQTGIRQEIVRQYGDDVAVTIEVEAINNRQPENDSFEGNSKSNVDDVTLLGAILGGVAGLFVLFAAVLLYVRYRNNKNGEDIGEPGQGVKGANRDAQVHQVQLVQAAPAGEPGQEEFGEGEPGQEGVRASIATQAPAPPSQAIIEIVAKSDEQNERQNGKTVFV